MKKVHFWIDCALCGCRMKRFRGTHYAFTCPFCGSNFRFGPDVFRGQRKSLRYKRANILINERRAFLHENNKH